MKERIRTLRIGIWKNKGQILKFDKMPQNQSRRYFVKFQDLTLEGFTLIELALVILLISITLLLFAPLLSSFVSSYRQDFALQRIEAFSSYHQGEIERSGKERIFCLDFENGEYWAELKGKENFIEITGVLGKRAFLPETLSFVDIVTSRGKFNEGIGSFSLSPSALEPVIIHLKDKKENYYSLYWKPLSGKMERGSNLEI